MVIRVCAINHEIADSAGVVTNAWRRIPLYVLPYNKLPFEISSESTEGSKEEGLACQNTTKQDAMSTQTNVF